MNNEKLNPKDALNLATQALREVEPTVTEFKAAGDRVWNRLNEVIEPQAVAGSNVVNECADFVGMIAAYRQKTLPASRRELFEDHVRNCVDCRRSLWQSEDGYQAQKRPAMSRVSGWQRWAAAAAAVLICGVAIKFGVIDRLMLSGKNANVVAERVDGSLFRVHDGQLTPINVNETVAASDMVRSGRGTRAILRLSDGSRVEMNEYAQLAIEPRKDGLAVALQRGSVIIEAAKQTPGHHLYVDAPDCEVAVKGTVFTVTHGAKGSRVSVLEGEVWVEQGGDVTKLEPGEQKTTEPNIAPVPVAEEVSWSSDPERYSALLEELSEVSKQVMAKLANVPLRYESKLVPLLPADTFICAAVPNVTGEIADAGTDLQRRIQANPKLSAWYEENRLKNPNAPDIVEVLARFRELGSYCGAEFVLGMTKTANTEHPGVLLLAQTNNEAGLLTAIRDNLQRMNSLSGKEIPVVIVDDPANVPATTKESLYIMVSGGLVAASDSAAEILRVAGKSATPATSFTTTPFYAQIARCYSDGVTWLFAANVELLTTQAVPEAGAENDARMAEELGLKDMQYVIFEHKRIASQSQLRGVVAFSRELRGVPAWLGAPAPMGALEFVSPNAYAVGCFLAKEPKQIADEVLAALKKNDPQGFGKLTDFEVEHGLSVRDDLAAPLGGEFLVAIDGPVLPKPSWKVVIQVENQVRLQQTLEKLVADLNVRLTAEAKPTLSLSAYTDDGKQFFYTLTSSDGIFSVHYTFWEGYWLIAGSKVLLTEAISTKRSGLSLPTTALFRSSLPVDGQQHYSALGFVNASTLGSAIASVVPSGVNPDAKVGLDELKKMLSEASTMSFCVTSEKDRILVTSTGLDLLNPSRMLEGLAKMQPSRDRSSKGSDEHSRPKTEI